jgi:tRNA (mo5U34)-methyltransferase
VNRNPELVKQIREHPWFHTMVLDDGLVTKGHCPPRPILSSSQVMPDVRNKSVLDIGAWDGKYSFLAESAGASRVVALDHYVWRLNPAARQAYYDECQSKGILPDANMIDRGFLVDDAAPGKRGFDLAHEYLGSRVEAVIDDFMLMDLDALGTFDVVFYFGVLYHMVNPLEALRRLRRVTNEVAVIETAGISVPAFSDRCLINFYPGPELSGDYGNWFAPSTAALVGMCRSAGFRRATIVGKEEELPWRGRLRRVLGRQPIPRRLIAHAFA